MPRIISKKSKTFEDQLVRYAMRAARLELERAYHEGHLEIIELFDDSGLTTAAADAAFRRALERLENLKIEINARASLMDEIVRLRQAIWKNRIYDSCWCHFCGGSPWEDHLGNKTPEVRDRDGNFVPNHQPDCVVPSCDPAAQQ